jgi:hypothetical protein
MYGFPAIWDEEKYPTLQEFYESKRYPAKDMDFALSYTRRWNVDENDK